MFLNFLDLQPDPQFFLTAPDPDPSINKQKMKKNLDFYCFVTSLRLFLNLQKGISIKTQRKRLLFVGVLKVTQEKSRIRIRIRNRICQSQEQIRGSGSASASGSLPICHGFRTLPISKGLFLEKVDGNNQGTLFKGIICPPFILTIKAVNTLFFKMQMSSPRCMQHCENPRK